MTIRVYLENLKKYNEGHSAGTWLTLPMKIDELEYTIQYLLDGDEEWVIADFEAPFLIDRYDDVFAINEAAAVLAQHDNRLIYALCGCTDSIEQVIRILRGGHYIVLQDVDSLLDVADELVRWGYFGIIPASVERYIDYDMLAWELKEAGWHMQYEVNIAILPLS